MDEDAREENEGKPAQNPTATEDDGEPIVHFGAIVTRIVNITSRRVCPMTTLGLKIQIIVSDVCCCRITIYKRTCGPGAIAGLVKFGEIVAEFAVGVDKPFLESWISIVGKLCDESFDMLLETTSHSPNI
jgi:hypothetical protein